MNKFLFWIIFAYIVIAVVWGFCVIVASLIWWEELGSACLISGATCLIIGVVVGFLIWEYEG